ncbi:MAG TPA: imidazolonepropionase [Gemmatimonadales bacterium]|nr:imidazolonepropionase [Gemmatimonadales bacterium]
MRLLTNIGLLARCLPTGPQGDLNLVPNASLAWTEGIIRWAGPEAELPAAFRDWPAESAQGRLVIPGLVDCHTHLAFAGWRAEEFEQRIRGAGYLEIAAAGGGIASTVAKTRAASTSDLLEHCRTHLAAMSRLGVTTVEAKSGYGLSLESELRILGVYRDLAGEGHRLVPTLLAAHVVPPEFRDRRADYIALVIEQIIPRAAAEGLARFCDVFVEETAFSIEEGRRILEAGKRHGLRPKLHADQLTSSGGAELAAEVGAASADHLECISGPGVERMARAGVVAVSLPFASLYLGVNPLPARRILAAGVPVAVATDFNPGSAPSYHLPVAMTLACTLQRMTPAEVLKGATIVAARAIGMEREVGSLEAGKAADFAVIDAESVEHWLYHLRPNACVRTVRGGETIWTVSGER